MGEGGNSAPGGAANDGGAAGDGSGGTSIVADLIEQGEGVASMPRSVVDSEGNVTAVWVQYDDAASTVRSIWANRYEVGTGWGAAEMIESEDMNADSPLLAVHEDGTVIAVWRQDWNGMPRYGIRSNRYLPGVGWEGDVSVMGNSDAGASAESGPGQLVMDPSGNAWVAWTLYRWDGNSTTVMVSHYSADGGWDRTDPMDMSSWIGLDPKIALDSAGTPMVVWYQSVTEGVFASRLEPAGTWETPVPIETTPLSGSAHTPKIGFLPDDSALAVWHNSGLPGISFNQYDPTAGWGESNTIVEPDPVATSADSVQLAFDGSGNAMAIWTRYHSALIGSYYVSGAGFQEPAIVALELDNYSEQLAFYSNGDALAVWNRFGASNSYDIWRSRHVAGAGWDTPTTVNPILNGSSEPCVVIDAADIATVIWVQSGSIYGLRF